MTGGEPKATIRLSRLEWRVLILLVFSVFINYIDRGNLSVAAPVLKGELGLNDYQLGKLFSSFFWTYAACQLFGLVGWAVDRFHVGWVLGISYFLWSGATALTGAVTGFGMLLSLRLLLGIGESFSYPAYSKILAANFPEHHRGIANGLIDVGAKVGPALGTLTGGILIAQYGWRPFFIVLGAGSLLWLLPWGIWMPTDHSTGSARAAGAPSLVDILRQRSAWGTFFGLFCSNYFWYFLLTWLPLYLVRERHFSMRKMALFGSLAYLTIACATTIAGFVSDRLIANGVSPTIVRKTCTAGGLLMATMIVAVAMVEQENAAMAILMGACFSYGIYSSSHWAITQTLAGPRAAGKWSGIQNGIANLAGSCPWITGAVVQWTGSFVGAFALIAAVVVTGATMYLFVIGPIRQVSWDRPGTTL